MDDSGPAFQWPGGHRSAVSIIVHVPGFGFSEDETSQENLLGLDYSQTGLRRLLGVLADLDMSATFAFTAESLAHDPELLREVHERGHEVAASFCSASGATDDLVNSIGEDIDARVSGILARMPGFPSSELDDSWGNDSGKAWLIDGRSGDLPVLQRDPDAALIPISSYLMDTTWLSPARPLPPSSMLETWSLALQAHRLDGTYMPVIVHPHISGRPGFVGNLLRFLDEVVASGDVWVARVDHIAATWHAFYGEE